MNYEQPVLTDLGDLAELTQAGAIGNTEDGAGKFARVEADPVVRASVAVSP